MQLELEINRKYLQKGDFNTTSVRKSILLYNTPVKDIEKYIEILNWNKKHPNFIINDDGVVYKILEENQYSNYFAEFKEFDTYNKEFILIALTNSGYIEENQYNNEDKTFSSWCGEKIPLEKVKTGLFKTHTNKTYNRCEMYTEKQYDSLANLSYYLINKYKINLNFVFNRNPINLTIDSGIYEDRTLSLFKTSLTNCFDYEKYRNKVKELF